MDPADLQHGAQSHYQQNEVAPLMFSCWHGDLNVAGTRLRVDFNDKLVKEHFATKCSQHASQESLCK